MKQSFLFKLGFKRFLLVLLVSSMAQTSNADWSVVDTLTGGDVIDLVADSSGNIYAATNKGGIFKSTDQGANWTTASDGLANLQIKAITIDGTNKLYIATSDNSASTVIYSSVDGADNWTQVSTMATNSVQSLFVDGTGLYAGSAGTDPMQVSADGGANWTSISTGLTI